jgi:hypothetical protein
MDTTASGPVMSPRDCYQRCSIDNEGCIISDDYLPPCHLEYDSCRRKCNQVYDSEKAERARQY